MKKLLVLTTFALAFLAYGAANCLYSLAPPSPPPHPAPSYHPPASRPAPSYHPPAQRQAPYQAEPRQNQPRQSQSLQPRSNNTTRANNTQRNAERNAQRDQHNAERNAQREQHNAERNAQRDQRNAEHNAQRTQRNTERDHRNAIKSQNRELHNFNKVRRNDYRAARSAFRGGRFNDRFYSAHFGRSHPVVFGGGGRSIWIGAPFASPFWWGGVEFGFGPGIFWPGAWGMGFGCYIDYVPGIGYVLVNPDFPGDPLALTVNLDAQPIDDPDLQ